MLIPDDLLNNCALADSYCGPHWGANQLSLSLISFILLTVVSGQNQEHFIHCSFQFCPDCNWQIKIKFKSISLTIWWWYLNHHIINKDNKNETEIKQRNDHSTQKGICTKILFILAIPFHIPIIYQQYTLHSIRYLYRMYLLPYHSLLQ